MARFKFGQSKVNCWRRCPQEYQYKHVENIVRKKTKRPFMFGKIIHRMIEAHAQGIDPMAELNKINLESENLFTAEKEMYGEIIEDIRTIMLDYFDYWQPRDLVFLPLQDENDEQRWAEHEFAIPIGSDLLFTGQIDAIAKTPNKLQWLVENKSFDKLPQEDHRWRNLQSVVYIWALKEMEWMTKVAGVCWNYIKSKPPTVPQVLKDGSRLSAKEIITLPSVVRATLKQHKLSEALHAKLMHDAERSRDEYFQRIFTPINETIADNIFKGFLESAQEMADMHGKKRNKNLGRHCEWCDYEPICRAELTGGDVDFVKEREFTHEEPESYRRTRRSEGAEGEKSKRATRSSKLRVVRS